MPFGPSCEYEDQAACERANQDRDDPAAYCAAIRRRTEDHCMGNRTVTGTVLGIVPFASPLPAAVGPERPGLRMARPLSRQARPWYRITAKAADPDEGEGTEPTVDGDTTIIDIYDEIGWFGTSAADFVRDLRKVDTPRIELHINSPGGDVFDGMAIYAALRQHKAQVHVIVDSLAASAASFIAMAGDKITATANAMLMIHDPFGLVIGNAADMRELADLLDKHGDNIASVYAARAGGEVADWRERMLAETWYLADEAYKAGLVDEVSDADGRPIEDRWDLSVFARDGFTPDSTVAAVAQDDLALLEPSAAPEPPADPPATPDPAPAAREKDAPRHPAPSDNGRRRSYLGETADWYLPPSRKEHT